MFLTKLALRRPVSTLLLLFTAVVFGISSLLGMRMSELPDIEMPTFIVFTAYPGADPSLVDRTVTNEVETIGPMVTGFLSSSSTSAEGVSQIMFQFDYDVDTDQTYLDLRAALDNVRLPEDAMDPFIMQIAFDALPMMNLSVSGAEGEDMLYFAEQTLVPRIETLLGVAQVDVSGGNTQYVRVELSRAQMSHYGLSMQAVSNAIAAYDFAIPVGSLEAGSQDISTSSTSSIDSLPELQNVLITTPSGANIPLSEVATIGFANEEPTSISRYNGRSDVSISITANSDSDVPTLSRDIRAALDQLMLEYPGINIEYTYDGSQSIIDTLLSVLSTLLLGVGLCMLVLYLFLGTVRGSLIVGSSIPLSLVCTMICMSLVGFELNLVTATALIIAIGMMVDNSIVVLESIFRTKADGGTFFDVAIAGCRTVSSSIVASTITTIVVYLPMAMVDGMSGQFFSELGFTIVFAMLASLLSAVILVPLFYFLFQPTEKKAPVTRLMARLETMYERAITRLLRKKKSVVTFSVLLLIGSFALLAFIPIELMPIVDSGEMQMSAEFRPGTSLAYIDEAMAPIEQMVAEDARFYEYTFSISQNIATLNAKIGDGTPTAVLIDEYIDKTAGMSDFTLSITMAADTMNTFSEIDVQTILSGHDLDTLRDAATAMSEDIYQIPGVINVRPSTGSPGSTEADIEVDPERALYYGLSASQVSGLIYQTVSGIDAMTLSLSDKDYDVHLSYPEGTYDSFSELMMLPIQTQLGTVPLSEMADLRFTDSLQQVQRTDGLFTITLSVDTSAADKASVQAAIDNLEQTGYYGAGVNLGVENSFFGSTSEELGALLDAILIAIFLVFIVMAVQFESIRFSVMVMTSIVFSFIGSFGLLFLTGQPLTMVSMMGLLMLMGIVVNNGILYVDTVNQLRTQMPLMEALVESGKLRMRPIFMTTLTTILSMVPLAFAIAEGSEMMQSMGIIIIGGLITSTILVLFLMPTFYLLIGIKDDKMDKKRSKKERRRAAAVDNQ